MAELNITWETVDRVSKEERAVVTGDEASDPAKDDAKGPALRWGKQPIIVYVCDEAAGCEGFDKLEEVVLKDEKVALGMKAFRRVKMHPDQVAADPLLADEGKEVPRMLLVDPTKMDVTVLEKNRLKASSLYSAMQRIAGRVYDEKLDSLVKDHLKILNEQDKLANAEKVLGEKLGRLQGDDGAKSEREVKEVKAEQAQLREEIQALATKQRALWKLTFKDAA